MKPRIGFFGFAKDIDAIAAAGYDFIEMHMHEVMKFNDEEFRETCKHLKDSPITCEILNNPIPLDKVIADESFDPGFYIELLKKGADRAAEMGIKYYVFGNGKTRSLPTTGDIKAAHEKNLYMMRQMADITASKGITILIEPLAPRVSNVALSMSEALEYAREIGKTNLATFLDYRWFLAQKHPMEDIQKYGKFINHVHIDNPTTEFPKRIVPRADDGHDYGPFFQALQNIDYNKTISIEANTFDDYTKDLKEGIDFFKHYGNSPFRGTVR